MNKHRQDQNGLFRFNRSITGSIVCSLLAMLAIEEAAAQPETAPLTAVPVDSVAGNAPAASHSAASAERAEPGLLSDVQVASFQDVVPGKSTAEQVIKQLGEPASRAAGVDLSTLIYRIDPFERVEFAVAGGVVDSIVVYLAKSTKVSLVTGELGLSGFAPATIADADGQTLGQAYPERGILLGFSPEGDDAELRVAQIVIETIGADSFLYRAKYNRGHQYLAALADLLYAQQLNPNDAESHALAGEILMHCGRYTESAKHIDRAHHLSGGQPEHGLLKAKLLARRNKYAEAVAETKRVLGASGLTDLTKADAQFHLGYLLSRASVPNFQQSLDSYTGAIKTAESLAEDESVEVRVAANRISFDAHLGVADNIARGPWKRNHEVSMKWVGRAEEIAKTLVQAGQYDESLLWGLQQKKLMVLVGAVATDDPAPIVAELIKLSKELIGDCQDPLFRSRVQFETGQALLDAAQLQHWRRSPDSALEYATIGAKLLETSGKQRDEAPDQAYRLGRAYFLIGSIHSILRHDHDQAIAWFRKAESRLAGPIPEMFEFEKNIHGDRFISMGVSFWQAGRREEAVKLTKQGINILEEAVNSGIAQSSALKIAYGNYGNMQKQIGKADEAEAYISRAAELPSPTRR